MSLSKETLLKTKELLQKEVEENSQAQSILRKVMEKEFHIDVFHVCSVSFYGKDDRSNSVSFKEINEGNRSELRFDVYMKDTFASSYSWSGWSSNGMKEQESKEGFEKALSYIEKVNSMLKLLKDYTEIYEVAKNTMNYYESNLWPLIKKHYDLKNEINKIDSALYDLKKEEDYKNALEFFKTEKWLSKGYDLTRQIEIFHCKVELDKKGNIILYFRRNLDEKKKIKKEVLINLYNFATRVYVNSSYKDKDFKEKYWYKYTVCYNTFEETQNIVKTEITEEEYRTIKGF